jgi:PleD family two-component response regulator
MVEVVMRLKREKFELAVVDNHFQDLAATCYRINCLWNTPLALIRGKAESRWDNIRFLDIDGYIPVEANKSELFSYFEEITLRGRNRTPEFKSSLIVLVIEDDRQTIGSIKQAFGFYWPQSRVNFATRGEEGIKFARSRPVDIILLNTDLSDKSGLRVLKKIRSICQAPVIVITPNKDENTIIHALQAGASDYLEKSFRLIELITCVRQNLRQATCRGKESPSN